MKIRPLYCLIILITLASVQPVSSQTTDNTENTTITINDTIYNPTIRYSVNPQKYEIAGITVSGIDNYEDYLLIGISGLSIGQIIDLPGEQITTALKRYWKQGLFSDVSITATKTHGRKVWLNVNLQQRPKISKIEYKGIKKSEREDLELKLGLAVGSQITPNLVNRTKILVERYFADKGFQNADVRILQQDDLSNKNEVLVTIDVDKKDKIKVHKIHIEGNNVLSNNKLQWTMKKTNELNKLVNLFRQKKFVQTDFDADKQLILSKYAELGYRDAVIVKDSVTPYNEKQVDIFMNIDEGNKYYIRNINFVGNTINTTEDLMTVLRMKSGDVYNQKLLNQRLTEDEDAIANLYMNNGYLFFQVYPIETSVENDSVDLEIRISEGKQATINKIIIDGNDRLYEHVIRRELYLRPGDLFSRSDLMRSAREIANTGHFNPETMQINPIPHEEDGTVDIQLGLESKSNDQIEFSAGWGQTGIIGRLSLKFTNFSLENLLNWKNYRGIIPQGDGQTLTISAQTNAQFYQSYSLSFFDPWFGGKRPNSFSLSAYYSYQSDVNYNYYGSYNDYYDYYYGNNYGNDNYYESALDPNKSIQMFGITAGLGKRLKWPDDYFTLSAELSYQLYVLKDWYYFVVPNGTSNSINLGLSVSRSSIDNPIYPRAGSEFSLSLQITPPYSLFDNIDYSKLDPKKSDEDRKKMYKWIEYHKWKFKSKTYTPLTDPEKKHTLVLMTRADFGILGSFNKYKQSPFETFFVGGDGMTGMGYSYATETIALRGYPNGSLTPYGSEAYAYTRIGMELRFPIIFEPSTTIYALAFIEGGNAWTKTTAFDPFDLKKSAGVGIRIMLPMIGLMGIDWAYGFDKVFGKKGGSNFHFILGQEF